MPSYLPGPWPHHPRVLAHYLASYLGICSAFTLTLPEKHSAQCDHFRRDYEAGRKPRVRVPAPSRGGAIRTLPTPPIAA